MPDDEDKGRPSLEPPSLFGRKKRGRKQAPEPSSSPPLQPPPAPDRADADIRPEVEPVPPPPADETPTTILDADRPTVVEAPTPYAPSAPPTGSPQRPLFADERPAEPAGPPVTAVQPVEPAEPVAPSVVPAEPGEPAAPKPPRGPWVSGWAAAVATGLVVGGLIVGGTAAAMRLCTAVKGTESCGNPGFLLLVAILAIAVVLGALMLRAARVPEPGSTSFLAVGLLSVVALLFLIDQLLEWWMAIAIPVVSVLTYLLAHWVARTYIDPVEPVSDDETLPELHDIR